MLYIPTIPFVPNWEVLWGAGGFGVPVPRPSLSKETSIHIKLFPSQSSSSTTSECLWKENSFHIQTLHTLPSVDPHLLFFTPPVFPFKLGNGSFIPTLNFSSGHLWRWKIFLLFFSLPPAPPYYSTVDCLQFPFLIHSWEIHSQGLAPKTRIGTQIHS